MKRFKLFIPTTKADLLRHAAVRISFCALPYFVLASLWSVRHDDRLFHGFWFWWGVVLIPGLGVALDLWRLQRTRINLHSNA